MNNTITQILTAINNICTLISASIENCDKIEVIKEKKDCKKACNIAEKIFVITDRYLNNFSRKDRFLYNMFKKRFDKYD